jgi:RecB family endonuclease NucS
MELKAGTATDSVLTQLLAYMADVKRTIAGSKKVRGIIIAHEFSERARITSFATHVEY